MRVLLNDRVRVRVRSASDFSYEFLVVLPPEVLVATDIPHQVRVRVRISGVGANICRKFSLSPK
jgi:hypothetical protein